MVNLSGLGITGDKTYEQTDANGKIFFRGLTLSTHPKGNVGYVIASISSSIGDTELKIPVVME